MLKATYLIISGFVILIAAGTVLLALPISSVDEPLSLIDAFFTATSAVCVTGLIVVDTATKFTLFGQIVILLLLQLGGLGLITFSVLVLLFAGRRISILQRDVISSTSVGPITNIDLKSIARPVILYVLISEGLGTIFLFFAFLRYFPIPQAFYHAIFQAVSAFCNAGFSTFSDSMVRFSGDWFVCLPIMALIVLGGMGFVVLLDVYETIKFKKPIYLHSKLVGITTIVLLVIGTLVFFALEYGNALEEKPLHEQVLTSMFHSVTTRTAGFNTVDYFDLTHGTLIVTIFFMVIGGSPGSTAGGIKTTTIAIIFLTAWARIRGKQDPEFANRSIAKQSVVDALTLVSLGTIFIMLVVLGLQITELGNVPHSRVEGSLMKLSFEGVSAFGTVGLSMGATQQLTIAGKILISITMFIGRLGPLTFFYLLGKLGKRQRYRLYPESVMVG